ncbi:MAG TPA: transglycosylase domain-containing protein, partial [Myxococcota bacterium]|nr:transglycosylase domain-containing protein [Myxococcota bacterium]
MPRWRWLVPPLLAVAGVAALPLALPALAKSRGVELERAFWCRQGLCFQGIQRGSITADYAWIEPSRKLVLVRPVLTLGGEGGGGAPAAMPGRVDYFKEVEVRDARVLGIPFEVPPLSGSVLPERHLEGDQIRIDGDQVTASVQSPYGPVTLQVEKVGSELVVEATCSPFRYQHPRLSEQALEMESVHLRGKLNEASFSGEVESGGVHVEITLQRPENLEQGVVEGSFQLPTTPVQDLYGLLDSVVPEARRATIRGTFSADGTFRWPLGEGDPEVVMQPNLDDLAVDGLVDGRLIQGSFTFQARNAAGAPIEVQKGEGSPGWLALSELGDLLPAAVIAAEDASFYRHPGYDLAGMIAAAEENQKAGSIRKG